MTFGAGSRRFAEETLTLDELERVETIVNGLIEKKNDVYTKVTSFVDTKAMHELHAVFDEVYSDHV